MKQLRKKLLETAAGTGSWHIPSGLSILDVLWVLYDRILDINPKKMKSQEHDHFILSKGHGSLGLYVVLAEKSFIRKADLKNIGKFSSILGGHPDRNKINGVEASTGSLGHGLPMAVGLALAQKISRDPHRVFVLVGDGECNEGTIWESALLAAHRSLNNLCCIIDFNHSTDRALSLGDLAKKFESFGWKVKEINGHDQEQIHSALKEMSDDKPLAIIAKTIKGNGCKMMENNPEWHHKALKLEDLPIILKELN